MLLIAARPAQNPPFQLAKFHYILIFATVVIQCQRTTSATTLKIVGYSGSSWFTMQ